MKKLFVIFFALIVVFSFAKTKLTFWGFMMNDEHAKMILNKFMEENPDIEVEYVQLSWANGFDKIVTAIAGGESLDVVELGNTWVANFAERNALENMDLFFNQYGKNYVGWDTVKYHGKYWAVPWLLGTRALFYNMELFEKAGLNPDIPPETWEDLYRAAKKIDALGDEIYGFGMPAGESYSPWQQWFLPAVWGTGGDIISEDGKRALLTSCKVEETAQFYKALSKYSLKTKQADLAKAFGEGKIGMYVSGAWDIDYLETNYPETPFNVVFIPKPASWYGTHASFAGAEVLAIMKHSKNKEAAQKLVKFLIRPDIAMEVAMIWPAIFPSHVEAGKDPWFNDHPMHKVFYEQNTYAKPVPSIPAWPKVQAVLTEAIEKIILENADIDSTLFEYNLKIQKILDGE
ncbi:ABC transporter substrate-binding protein [Thermosipho sp. 1063]|uniref:extracellular solute-binding protein n=1 Tax=unclassified Thermosipho (in: thermotogales) TaxID=2676525 RepID=UPI0009506535|nr:MULTISPECIES: extracellular solute-binding protein [unclassified Thermosipho (in: thermotogales)]APT72213.1 ABC transporter substrate-binding protein [Thermosipho sp. 1063]OOC43457.1 ABC transporter substrate-binding protein [Thermosipho sp. 1074]